MINEHTHTHTHTHTRVCASDRLVKLHKIKKEEKQPR